MAAKWQDADVYQLIQEISKKENFKVLYGTNAGERTSGDSKAKVYKRIAGEMGLDSKGGHARVKRKLDDLQSTFKGHMKRLRRTGEGVTDDDSDTSQYYFIDRAGPYHDTPDRARNIWEEIRQDFKFFPELYRIWHGRPNLLHETIMIQGTAPSSVAAQNSHNIPIDPVLLALEHPARSFAVQNSHNIPIDPVLLALERPAYLQPANASDDEHDALSSPSSQTVTPRQPIDISDKENVHPQPTPGSHARRSSSSFGRIVATTPTIPRKRGAEDEFLDLTRNMVNTLSQQTRDAEIRKQRKMVLKERQVLMDEFKAGVYELHEYRTELEGIKRRLTALPEA